MPNPNMVARNQHAEDVEPVFEVRCAESIDPNLGRPAEFPTFPVVDCLDWRPERRSSSSLDLDERHDPIATHDEVDVPMTAPKPMRDYDPSIATQPARRDSLTLQPKCLSLLCHGPTVQQFRETPSPKSRNAGHRYAAR